MTAPLPAPGDVEAMLDDYHRQIDDALARKLRASGGDAAGRAQALAQIRWELVRILRAYQLFKHTRIFDPFIARGDAAAARLAGELKARCLAADEGYKAHVRAWSLTGSESDWAAYEAELLRIVNAVRAHLAAEGMDIRALLARR